MPEGTDAAEHGEALELGGDNKPSEVSLMMSWPNVLETGDLGRESKGKRG